MTASQQSRQWDPPRVRRGEPKKRRRRSREQKPELRQQPNVRLRYLFRSSAPLSPPVRIHPPEASALPLPSGPARR
jgi:hypothetical protein